MRSIKGAALVLGLLLVPAACGVDKQGAANEVIDLISEANDRELTKAEKDCLTKLVVSLSEDQLKAIADRSADAVTKDKFDLGTFECLSGFGS